MIPTAEEYLSKHPVSGYDEGDYYKPDVEEFMIEFAKLHVKAALQAAATNAFIRIEERDYGGVRAGCKYPVKLIDRDSILDAYSLTNIK